MPRSKRNKVVSLTKTQRKPGNDAKKAHIDSLRGALETYKNIYLMRYDNMRTTCIREIRMHFKESKLFIVEYLNNM